MRRRTGIRGFDFEQDSERAAIGHLLGLIVERNRPTTGLLISALVQYLNTNDAGPGFYALAADLGLLPRRSLGNGEASILGRTTQRAVRLLRHQSSGRLTIA